MISKQHLILLISLIYSANLLINNSLKAAPAEKTDDFKKQNFVVQTMDHVSIKGSLYDADNDKSIIYCHRLLDDEIGEEVGLLIDAFLNDYDLVTFNFRGHKSSFGRSSMGGDEVLDLHAVISLVIQKGYERIVILGTGMGGTVGARTAMLFHNVDALIVISPSGFSPGILSFHMKVISDITLDSPFGKVPVRILTNTRLGPRYSAGFPIDFKQDFGMIPILIIHSDGDRFVNLNKMKTHFEDVFDPRDLFIVPGNKHAEDLIDPNTLREARMFLENVFDEKARNEYPELSEHSAWYQPDSIRVSLTGDLPLPERILSDELRRRLSTPGTGHDMGKCSVEVIRKSLIDVLAFRGYTRASVEPTSTAPNLSMHIAVPKIHSLSIEGARWVDQEYIRNIVGIGHDYFNAYELDSAIRRLSMDPAFSSVNPVIVERNDREVDIHLIIKERRPYRLLVATKFTDIDRFFGAGFAWNENNPTRIRYDGRVLFGIDKHDILTSHNLSKDLVRNSLRISASFFDMIRSRDDLDYVFTRQEVHEVGGELSARYILTSSTNLQLGLFGKRYRSPEVSLDLPVHEGDAGGVNLKFCISGKLPLQGAPRVNWKQTLFYQKAGPWKTGDFSFDTYQINLGCDLIIFRHHVSRTAINGGWIRGVAPPQELLSLGGMSTLPGYRDDSFVDTRMILASQTFYLSARSLFEETSAWSPFRLILSCHAGTVWGKGSDFSSDELYMDAGIELDYLEILRFGIVWPVGPNRFGPSRLYVGWGVHVY